MIPPQLKDYPIEEIFKDEAILIEKNPLKMVKHEFLNIKTKEGNIVKLRLNSVQKKVLNKIVEILEKFGFVRLWILKARQTGISTIIESILYAFTSQKEGVNSCVIADELKGSNYLFEMQKLFQERLDEHLKPNIKHSNEKKLEFEGKHSQVLIDTAENAKVGRKYTFRYVHLSEVAFFPHLETLMLGLSQSVPRAGGTMIIGETTANGIGNEFYERWNAAVEGKTDWQTLFIPWFELPEYQLPLVGGRLYPIETIKDNAKFLKEEDYLREKYHLSEEQLNWRRWCIVNNCNNDVLKFRQEYPATAEEAFITSGELFFDREALLRQVEKPFIAGNIVKYEGRWLFRKDPDGRFKIYEFPKSGMQYCIGADTAEGLPHGDRCAADVGNKRTTDTAATYNCNTSPEEFSEDLYRLGYFYNEAMIAPENKGYGYSVCQSLWKRGYPHIYRGIKDKKGLLEPGQNLGFNTNPVSRPQMLSQFYDEIKEHSTELCDKDLIRQCWSFIKDPDKKKPMANKGSCDDLLMARAIRGQVMVFLPYRPINRTYRRVFRRRGLSGY